VGAVVTMVQQQRARENKRAQGKPATKSLLYLIISLLFGDIYPFLNNQLSDPKFKD
jgi:hypothetical protein